MDPVLSSTIDFDNYIKHHLTTSSRERRTPRSSSDAPIHSRIYARNALDDDTTVANRIIHNVKNRRDPHISPTVDAALQASMLQVNASRYNLNSTGSTRSEKKQLQLRREKDKDNAKGRTAQTIPRSAVEPLVLQHSWRAYLKHDGRGDGGIARIDREHSDRVGVSMGFDDELTCGDVPRSHVPTPISARDEDVFSGASSVSARRTEGSADGWAFSEYRVRLVSLKHFFNVWREESVRSHLLLYKRSAAVVAASRLHRLSLIVGCWRRHFQSGRFHCVALCRHGISKLLGWRYRSRRRCRSIDGYYWVQCRLALRAFRHNRRMELDRQRRRALTLICLRHYQCNLAKAVFLGWKRYSCRARNEQMLMSEHSARQDKISSFMSSLRTQQQHGERHGNIHRVAPPKAPPAGPRATNSASCESSSRTLKGDAGDKSIGSTRHPPRRTSNFHKHSSDALPSRSRRDDAKAVQRRGLHPHADYAPLNKRISSNGDARNANTSSYFTSAKAESKMQRYSDVDGQSCSSDEDGAPASAPSYDEVMKLANPKDAMSGEATDHPHPPPHSLLPPRMDAKCRELSMEERHRERRERVALLQRQAEERVAARNREKELKEK